MTTDTLELPELPEHAAAWVIPGDDGGSLKEWVDAKADSDGEFTAPLFTAKDMRAYATAAVLADRKRIEQSPVVQFLFGADDLDGVGFLEVPPGKPRFWWRSLLRSAIRNKE